MALPFSSVDAYCRVSSKRQKNDAQQAEIKRWLEGNGIDPASVRWYFDKESGRTLQREAFDRLQRNIFEGTVRTIVVWKLDRLSRRLKDGVNLLADWCERGLRVVIVTQAIDLSGPVGRMIAAVLLGLAEIEWEYRKERQAAGIEVARKRGVYKGRARGTLKGKPARAIELRSRGLAPAEIATALGTSERTIWRYLRAQLGS